MTRFRPRPADAPDPMDAVYDALLEGGPIAPEQLVTALRGFGVGEDLIQEALDKTRSTKDDTHLRALLPPIGR